MVEVPQELHLSKGTETEHGVIEGGDLLNGNFLARRLVESRTRDTVSSSNTQVYVQLIELTRQLRMRLHPPHPECHTDPKR